MKKRIKPFKEKKAVKRKKSVLSKVLLLLIPTISAAGLIVILKLIPKPTDIIIRFENPNVCFSTDFGKTQAIVFMEAITVSTIRFKFFSPIEMSVSELYAITSDNTLVRLNKSGKVKISTKAGSDSEMNFYDGTLKLGSLKIAPHSIVNISMSGSCHTNNIRLNVTNASSAVYVQKLSDSAKVMTRGCELIDENNQSINHPSDSDEKRYLFMSTEIDTISRIKDFDNNLVIDLDVSKEYLKNTKVFETSDNKDGIPIKRLGFNKADINLFNRKDTVRAICKIFRVGDVEKDSFHDQPIICQGEDFEKFRIDSLNIPADSNNKIIIQLQTHKQTKKFRVGSNEANLSNIVPSYFDWIMNTDLAKIFCIIAWVFTTSLSIFLSYRDTWRKR